MCGMWYELDKSINSHNSKLAITYELWFMAITQRWMPGDPSRLNCFIFSKEPVRVGLVSPRKLPKDRVYLNQDRKVICKQSKIFTWLKINLSLTKKKKYMKP